MQNASPKVGIGECSVLAQKSQSPGVASNFAMSIDSLVVEGGAHATAESTETKTFRYVPPRIDPDQFQVLVPEWHDPNDGKTSERSRRTGKGVFYIVASGYRFLYFLFHLLLFAFGYHRCRETNQRSTFLGNGYRFCSDQRRR